MASVDQPITICFATPTAMSTKEHAAVSTDGAEIPLLTAVTAASLVAQAKVVPVPVTVPHPLAFPREMMVDVGRTLVALLATQMERTADAARLTATAALQMDIVLWLTVARMAAKMPALPPPSRPPLPIHVPLLQQPQVNLFWGHLPAVLPTQQVHPL